MENIKGILVSIIAPMENHIANGGEKLLGNASSIKRRNDGKVYVSGQMQRHVLFSAINRLNLSDENKGDTYVSNGDGIGNAIEVDLRADMGGFMHPSAGSYSGRRTAPLSVTPAVAIAQSQITRDLLVRMKVDTATDSRDQALATKEQSDSDIMVMNFFLDVTNLSISKKFTYEDGFHVKTDFVKHVTELERIRRVKLFLEATRSMIDYANEARNAVTGEPQKVLIVFDSKMSRKACRYFEANTQEQKNIIEELVTRNSAYFLGDDTEGNKSVDKAYREAFEELSKSNLFDPCDGDENISIFAKTFLT
jgi:CRISPR-associated protein Cst2